MATVIDEPPMRVETPTLQDWSIGWAGFHCPGFWPSPRPARPPSRICSRSTTSKRHLCELADGVLVEKAMGLRESLLACALISLIRAFVIPRKLGLVSGEAGTIQLLSGLIRVPDVAFISWSRFPGGRVPDEPMPRIAPDLVIEVLSKGNTKAEMRRKRREYFEAGVDVVWEVDPEKRTAAVYHRGQSKPVLHDQTQTIECSSDSRRIPPCARRSLRRTGPNERETEECMSADRCPFPKTSPLPGPLLDAPARQSAEPARVPGADGQRVRPSGSCAFAPGQGEGGASDRGTPGPPTRWRRSRRCSP